mmetsp:Transcript_60395/g.155661  ORF Transcript_60395/g.155661 Transcript_60395/m.155661 type:complete len:282 (-) Transcript_60395:220-1065(-)
MFRIALCALLWAAAQGAVAVAGSGASRARSVLARQSGQAKGFVQALQFRHRLRVCNAYPYAAAVDVHRGAQDLTAGSPMPYKSCRDFKAPLKAGDRLEFKVGGVGAGTFSVSDLPSNDAVLMLVIYRHDTVTTAVSFESHVFANLVNAQIAVIDTYRGGARATPRISDAEAAGGARHRSEELRYDSIVAVNPGVYEVALTSGTGDVRAKSQLVALNRESYVVLRIGVDAEGGDSYPEDILVYPRSDLAALRGSSRRAASSALAVALAVAAAGLHAALQAQG